MKNSRFPVIKDLLYISCGYKLTPCHHHNNFANIFTGSGNKGNWYSFKESCSNQPSSLCLCTKVKTANFLFKAICLIRFSIVNKSVRSLDRFKFVLSMEQDGCMPARYVSQIKCSPLRRKKPLVLLQHLSSINLSLI